MLSLASSWWLLALLALPLVWWLHRFQEPDQTYPVAALFLWRAHADVAHQRRQARHAQPIWWLRALTVGLLIVALCSPQWRSRERAGLTVWIDDSLSMFALEQGVPRMHQALAELQAHLESGHFGSITLRSLGDPGRTLELSPQETASHGAQLRAWSDSARGEPDLPAPAMLDPGQLHWLVSDGASENIAAWARQTPLAKVIATGAATDNVALSALSLRRSGSGEGGAQLLLSITNGGGRNEVRVLDLFADGELLASQPLDIDAGSVAHEVIALDSVPTASVRATIKPADALPMDDFLELPQAALQRTGVHVSEACNGHLRTALSVHPALVVQDGGAATTGLRVYCGAEPSGWRGPTLRVAAGESFAPVRGEVFWSAASGQLRNLSLDSAWLSAPPQDKSPSAELVLLGTADQPLIMFDVVHKIIDVRLNLASTALVDKPEYPLLIAGLVDLLLESESAQRGLVASQRTSPASIAPQLLPPDPSKFTTLPATVGVVDLVDGLIIIALLLLLLDCMLLLRHRHLTRSISAADPE